jgi:DUF1680 family protein
MLEREIGEVALLVPIVIYFKHYMNGVEMKQKKSLIVFTSLLALGWGLNAQSDYPFHAVEMTNVAVRSGFWLPRIETNRLVTIRSDFKRSEETGRIHNFEAAGRREGKGFKGIPYDDSDVYKIIEGASYTLATHPDPKLDRYLDNLISKIAKAQEPDGYLYTARTLGYKYGTNANGSVDYGLMGPARWSTLVCSHELYNIGHMYEAAVAHYRATGKRSLLDVAVRSADLVERTFGFGETQLKDPPGHEEIELALCSLYRVTGERRYLDLAKRFLDLRGRKDLRGELWGASVQDHLPVVDQREAVGHSVRAAYLYCAMADVAALAGDKSYVKAIDALWENVVSKKLHLNGGIGARRRVTYKDKNLGVAFEALGDNYDLPNEDAYLETCAAIGNALWNQRMFLMRGDAKYVDVLERILYNGFLSGISLKGDEFFYPNPLASNGKYQRSKWFTTSCCPVNIARFIPQIASFGYATRGNAAYVNLFIESEASLRLAVGEVKLIQRTQYPWDGVSRIVVNPQKNADRFELNVRVPGWCVGRPVPSDLYRQVVPGTLEDFTVKVNGEPYAFKPQNGYCKIDRNWKKGDMIEVVMNMPVRRIQAHDSVEQNRGRLAVERGPVVYCAEGVDNGGKVLDKAIRPNAKFKRTTCNILGNQYPAFCVETTAKSELKLVPYFSWCHRDVGEMQTWFPAE